MIRFLFCLSVVCSSFGCLLLYLLVCYLLNFLGRLVHLCALSFLFSLSVSSFAWI